MLTTFGHGTLFGERHGHGAPRVLALHGWGRDHRDWDLVLAGLDAVAVDLPGFGSTPPPPDPWDSARYAEAVAAVLDDVDPAAPVVVAGHSFGGRVAIRLAAARPDRVGALVLTGVPALWPDASADRPRPKPAAAYRVVRWAHRRGLVSDARLEAARQRHGSADYRAAQGVLRGVLVTVLAERYDADLAALGCPVHLVWGEDDSAAPVAQAVAAAAALDHVDVEVLAGVDHFTPTRAPAAVRQAIDRALADTAGSRRAAPASEKPPTTTSPGTTNPGTTNPGTTSPGGADMHTEASAEEDPTA